jgi:hypothetical protein
MIEEITNNIVPLAFSFVFACCRFVILHCVSMMIWLVAILEVGATVKPSPESSTYGHPQD